LHKSLKNSSDNSSAEKIVAAVWVTISIAIEIKMIINKTQERKMSMFVSNYYEYVFVLVYNIEGE